MVKKIRRYLYSFWRNSRTWQTDGHHMTTIAALMHSIARQKLLTLHNWCMLPDNNVLMFVGHLDDVLIVYSSMEHVTWKSPGPMCGWVGRILHPDSCTLVSSWSKMPLLSIWSIAVPLCRPLLPCPSRWHSSLPQHGLWWWTCELHYSTLPWRLGSVYQLWKSLLLSCVPWSSDRTSCLSPTYELKHFLQCTR